jgi:hypothetical protein
VGGLFAMPYSEFTLESACQSFSLGLNAKTALFEGVAPVPVGAQLHSLLGRYVPMAVSIHTEKARSEFIVAPILAEVRWLMDETVSLFSGVSFEVDRSRGLDGTCDFILSASDNQWFVTRPLLIIVEAKNDNIKSGLGQCAAEMVAARLFNQRHGEDLTTIYGAVTTGSVWQFLKLESDMLHTDVTEYYLDQVDKILGILLQCVGGDPNKIGAAA